MTAYPHYKHYVGITSQINFCQVPFRLDTFNQCAFSCSYCFAKSRGGHRGSKKLQVSRSENLEERFQKIKSGIIVSAVDEFLHRRVPIQFGGMTDPFSPLESKHKATLKHLEILHRHQYPTLISTKGAQILGQEYENHLATGNFLIRFSISVVGSLLRPKIERGIDSLTKVLRAIERLSTKGVACAVRFQPIIPGQEKHAFGLVKQAADSGTKHVTFEYLKLPADDRESAISRLKHPSGSTLSHWYQFVGATLQGREFILPTDIRKSFLADIGRYSRQLGMTVGFGDNEFLPFGDGASCCNGSDIYLRNVNLFTANAAGIVRKAKKGAEIKFSNLASEWMPKTNIGTYLNSNVRNSIFSYDWRKYLEDQWKVGGIYSPDFFHGVIFTGRTDRKGYPIFRRDIDQF